MESPKDQVRALLGRLPDDCSLEDIQYHLYVIEKVRAGLRDAEENGTIPQAEVEQRMKKWLQK